MKFGRLIVLKVIGATAMCKCDCGSLHKTRLASLKVGNTTSCGCKRKESVGSINRTHGLANKLPEYSVWKGMRGRCHNPNDKEYPNYGGRGIKVCSRWNNFALFLKDLGSRPGSFHTIERLDNNAGYCPSNTRWAHRSEQGRNTRRCSINLETARAIRHLRRLTFRPCQIRDMLGLHKSSVTHVLAGRTWRELPYA
jgi:hypothetical protein